MYSRYEGLQFGIGNYLEDKARDRSQPGLVKKRRYSDAAGTIINRFVMDRVATAGEVTVPVFRNSVLARLAMNKTRVYYLDYFEDHWQRIWLPAYYDGAENIKPIVGASITGSMIEEFRKLERIIEDPSNGSDDYSNQATQLYETAKGKLEDLGATDFYPRGMRVLAEYIPR